MITSIDDESVSDKKKELLSNYRYLSNNLQKLLQGCILRYILQGIFPVLDWIQKIILPILSDKINKWYT